MQLGFFRWLREKRVSGVLKFLQLQLMHFNPMRVVQKIWFIIANIDEESFHRKLLKFSQSNFYCYTNFWVCLQQKSLENRRHKKNRLGKSHRSVERHLNFVSATRSWMKGTHVVTHFEVFKRLILFYCQIIIVECVEFEFIERF